MYWGGLIGLVSGLLLFAYLKVNFSAGERGSHVGSMEKVGKVRDFQSFILEVDADIGDLTGAGGLFHYDDFRKVHQNPEPYLDDALELIRDDKFTEQQKTITALSMQKLQLQKFVEFSRQMIQFWQSGIISEKLLWNSIFPSYEWNTILVENYTDDSVMRLLKTLLEAKTLSEEHKQFIREEVMSGRAKEQVLDLRESEQIP